MKELKYSLILTFLVFNFGCNTLPQEYEEKEILSLTKSQLTIKNAWKDIKQGADYDKIMEKYFFNSQEIEPGGNDIFYRQEYKMLTGDIIKHKNSMRLYWNEKISELSYFYWAFDTLYCTENLLIVTSGDFRNCNFYGICFEESGLIESYMPILDKKSSETIWVR